MGFSILFLLDHVLIYQNYCGKLKEGRKKTNPVFERQIKLKTEVYASSVSKRSIIRKTKSKTTQMQDGYMHVPITCNEKELISNCIVMTLTTSAGVG